ncbi:unnamed protein product, partial [Meganyctiphanes norvegica]
MIALDNQPFSILEDDGFKSLMHALKPNYDMPSRRFMTYTIIDSIYEAAKKSLKETINIAKYISITTDIWSSSSDDTFISCTGHCIFDNFVQQVVVLHTRPFPKNPTGENISKILKNMVQEYNIPNYKIHAIVHDNAANMICGVEATGFHSLTCFLHTTQLAINECILDQRYVKDIIVNCRKVAGHFNRSPLAYTKLYEIQKRLKRNQLKVKQDVATRWNSTHIMLSRMLEIKTDIVIYCAENSINIDITFDANQWAMMQKVVDLLHVFQIMTEKMSEQYANSSEIIPQIKKLKLYVTNSFTK